MLRNSAAATSSTRKIRRRGKARGVCAARTSISFRGGTYDICGAGGGAKMNGDGEKQKGKGTKTRETKTEREREIGGDSGTRMNRKGEQPGKERGRSIINWPRISFAPFCLSVLSLPLSFSPSSYLLRPPEEPRFLDGSQGTGKRSKATQRSGDRDSRRGKTRGKEERRHRNLSENLQAAPFFTVRDVPLRGARQ